MTHNITIHPPRPGSPLTVTPDKQPLNKNSPDVVEWNCAPDCNFSVDFEDGSPFDGSHFNNGSNKSGRVRGDAELRPYKYTVKVGSDTLDPQIIVN